MTLTLGNKVFKLQSEAERAFFLQITVGLSDLRTLGHTAPCGLSDEMPVGGGPMEF